MRALWFKSDFVSPILSGEKRSTLRRSARGIRVGEVVSATVGPRSPFATLEIVSIDEIAVPDLPADEREVVARLYGDVARVARIAFIARAAPGHTRT